MSQSVSFSDQNETFMVLYDKNKGLKYDKTKNRRLRFLEEYMRQNSLLMKNEYLSVVARPFKHMRIPYIELIAKQFGLMPNNKYLEILTT